MPQSVNAVTNERQPQLCRNGLANDLEGDEWPISRVARVSSVSRVDLGSVADDQFR